jgi:DNA modification methylase
MKNQKRKQSETQTPVVGPRRDPAASPPLRLEWLNADELADNPANWRRHPQAQLSALTDVLAEVGWAGALLYNEATGRLIDGHARKALTRGGQVPVLIGSWTAEQEKTILATLDPLAAMAEADPGKLEALLREVQPGSDSVAQLLAGLALEHGILADLTNGGLIDPDAVPAPPEAPTTRPGDLWRLGHHRLLCGDAGKSEDVDRLVDGATIHLVHTDPPYNVKVEPRSNNAIAAGLSSFAAPTPRGHNKRRPDRAKPARQQLRAKDRPLTNDFMSDAEFNRLLRDWFGNVARVLVPGRAFYLWGGYSNAANYPPALQACGLYFSQAIIWDKQHPALTRKDYMGAHEWCFYGWKEGAAHQFFGPANVTDLWSIKKVNPQHMVHLTQKPVELAARALQYSSRPGEHVLDLFAGSGSTLMAAEATGRKAFLMEIDPPYCDVIVERWQAFTGRKAKR